MGDFLGLLDSLDPDVRVRGRQFERVCKWFLANDPQQYRNMLRRVWLWDDWPGRWGPDAGIDLVAEDHEGRLWAVQAKAYDPRYTVTKADVDTFLSESSRAVFSYRLLIATTDRLSPHAGRIIDDLGVGFVGRATLLTADLDWPASLDDLRPSPPPEPAKPRDYQREAIDAVIAGFHSADRGQLIMACGTGKTLTAQFIADELQAQRTLVLVPSLSLLKQTMRVWQTNSPAGFEVMAVCSDATVGRNEDSAVTHVSELGMPVTTEPTDIAAFLRKRSRPRVVFSTYQSSPRIAAAYELGRVAAFDIVVADEAHRCAGPVSSDFATVLDAGAIKAKRRLFMTATPRYYTGRITRAAAEADFEVASMDDEARFGKVFHRLGFSEAIQRNLLTDYQVVVVGVDDATYLQWAERGTLVTRDGKNIADARSLAGQIGLAKAMWKYDLRRVISFHSRVNRAREFATELPEVINWMPARQRPRGQLWARPATGEMSAGERHVLLQHLVHLEDGQRGLLTNARCLAEGVDVPALDGVAFIDPRRSEVDIVQAVGRAIRKSEDKSVGTIVIPVFIDADTDPEKALDDSVFKPVWDVVKAVRAHDESLAEQLDSLRRSMGPRRGVPKLPSKIRFDLPVRVGADFARAFDTRLVEQTTASWEFWIGLLENYVAENGTALVPVDRQVEGYALGSWVATQRHSNGKGRLAEDRFQRLDALPGWTWDPVADYWTEHFLALKAFAETESHARVPHGCIENGLRLGQWVAVQRRNRAGMSQERVLLLESLPGWSWNPHADGWDKAYALLVDFAERHGHARVLKSYVAGDVNLGKWVTQQRSRRDELSSDQCARLESLPGWDWDARGDQWRRTLGLLGIFADREGHCRVPQGHVEGGTKLGIWVNEQRTHREDLPEDRRKALESVPGWSWSPKADQWEQGYAVLVTFAEREGHARVPKECTADGFRLGGWVASQRTSRQTLTHEQVARLEALPRWSWNALEDSWEDHFATVQAFAQREGHTRVPVDYIEEGLKLGQWVRLRRREHGKLNSERRARLEALPGWFWGRSADYKWEQAFVVLEQFAAREGHARVPYTHIEEGFKLGGWVVTQRTTRTTLPPERVARLQTLPGWSWTVADDTWDERYALLLAYSAREGHTRVPQSHVEGGVRLGKWVSVQRQKRNSLDFDRRTRLEAVPGWSWKPDEDQWERLFLLLRDYTARHGTSRVPYSYTENGDKLGTWVSTQRAYFRKGNLDPARVRRLERLPGWMWDPPTGPRSG